MTQTKTCTTCNTEKAVSDFYRHRTGKFGVAASCKVCASKASCNWAKRNKEKKRSLCRKYYSRHASKWQEYGGVKHWPKRLLKNAVNSSEARKLDAPTIDEAWILEQPMVCPYTGLVLAPSAEKSLWQPSLDRVDNTKGYTPENTRLTCLGWNLLRNDLSIEHALSLVSHLRAQVA